MVKELEHRQSRKRAFYSWPTLLILAFLTFFLVKGAAGLLLVERESARRADAIEREYATLSEREEALKAELERLSTPEGVIETIKEKFSAAREGEHVAIIVDARRGATSTAESGGVWYLKLWDAIMRK